MRTILWLMVLTTWAMAESRVALLIGNSAYSKKQLQNPVKDVDLLAKKLEALNFTVLKKKNLTRSGMLKALKAFYRQIDKETIALVYFSGHGVHSTIDNKNYLIPIGAFDALLNEEDLSNEAISDGKLLASTSGAKFSILLLDACRSNDFAAVRGDKGLGQPHSRLNNDYVISYATEVGKTARDGHGNSPYVLALAEYLSAGYSIGDIFTKVRAKVSRETGGKQKPYYAPHFENILYLTQRTGDVPVRPAETPPSTETKPHDHKYITTIGNLMWQDEPYTEVEKEAQTIYENKGKVGDWFYAVSYCKTLQLGGYADWRLPNIIELKQLYRKKKKLKSVVTDYYWSSITSKVDHDDALRVFYGDNVFVNSYYKSRKYYVRCVRDGR